MEPFYVTKNGIIVKDNHNKDKNYIYLTPNHSFNITISHDIYCATIFGQLKSRKIYSELCLIGKEGSAIVEIWTSNEYLLDLSRRLLDIRIDTDTELLESLYEESMIIGTKICISLIDMAESFDSKILDRHIKSAAKSE